MVFGLFKRTPSPEPAPAEQSYGGGQQPQTWAYSKCDGSKKAVLIGVNYFNTSAELKGCINDVQNLREFLTGQWGYSPDSVVTLTDDQEDPRGQPTKANIIAAAQWLVSNAQPDDSLFFHFSGHGTSVKDSTGDERDGKDEAICAVDYQTAGLIVDDELHELLVAPLPVGCRMTVLFDCCHSGSALDLPYTYTTAGKIKEPNRLLDAGQGLMAAHQAYTSGDMGAMFRSAKNLFDVARGTHDEAHEQTKATRSSDADVIFLSGCKDEQTSADTVEGGEATGAMSFAFISALTEKPKMTYKELLVAVRAILQSNYSQKPQLSASHEIDTDLQFVI